MYARTDGIWTSSASTALTCTTRAPPASSARFSGASALPWRCLSWSGVRSRTSPRRRSTSGPGSISSAPVASIASVAADSASRHSSSTSTASRPSPPARWRSSSKTSSISCVSAAMPAKPIVALMPFIECAIRKIASIVS